MSVFPYKHPTLNGVYMRCNWAHIFGQCCILPSKDVYVGMMEKYCFSSQYRPHMETRGNPKLCYHGMLIVPRHDSSLQVRVSTSFQKCSRCDIFIGFLGYLPVLVNLWELMHFWELLHHSMAIGWACFTDNRLSGWLHSSSKMML
jgi:hypothetical protein